ncbi:MAG: hypothetical protein AAF439_01555 [Pseudomonadota bacterium]
MRVLPFIRQVLCVSAVLLGVLAALTQDVRAQQAGSVEKAVSLWLAGDDEQSLPMLAELASAGDTDARLLLGRIETQDRGFTPFRRVLSPEASRRLFRYDNGTAFGQTWLVVEAASGNELAKALLASKGPAPNPAVINKLNQLGEREATDHPTRILALYGDSGAKRTLRDSADVLTDLIPYLDYLSGEPEPRGDGLAALRHLFPDRAAEVSAQDSGSLEMASLLALGLGFGGDDAANKWRADVEAWLQTAPSTRPIHALCQQTCGADVGPCGFAMLALSGGYFEAIRLDSPLEAVIPQQTFLDSARARQMLLNRVTLARAEDDSGWLSDLPELPKISQCVADAIRLNRRNYE